MGLDDRDEEGGAQPAVDAHAFKRQKTGAGSSKAAKAEAAKFRRGEPVATRKIEDRKLKGKLRYTEGVVRDAQADAALASEWLLPSDPGLLEAEGLERTWRFQQADIVQAVDVGAARKAFDLRLEELGPYRLDFTRSGRYMLLGGRRGHLALLDWARGEAVCEVQVRETTHDVAFLHNETFFAAAQKKYVYIYDKRGIEIHCLKEHIEARRLSFLPHHFLLASVGATGMLRYQDTSTGQVIAQHRTRLGPCDVLAQNPANAVLALGHGNGTLSMWTPNINTPVVRMLCHHGPLRAAAVDSTGHHLVTSGADGQVKVWDVRTFRPLHAYYSPAPATALDVSQRGLLAVGHGRRLAVWKDALAAKAQAPYMTHTLVGGTLANARFCPYEDVLAAGHSGGVSSMLVPGAGEPNYDSYVADPFQGRAARREAEVRSLLDKLQPDMIVLDPGSIGAVRREPRDVQRERREEAEGANAARRAVGVAKNEQKSKMKGKNKPSRRQKKKQQNIIDERKPLVKARMREEGVSAEFGGKKGKAAAEEGGGVPEGVPRALHRLYGKA